MSNTDKLKQRAALDLGAPRRRSQVEQEEPEKPAVKKPAVKIKSTRISADLSPQTYTKLLTYSAEATARRGSRVTHVEIVRALLEEMFTDPDLTDRVEVRLNSDSA